MRTYDEKDKRCCYCMESHKTTTERKCATYKGDHLRRYVVELHIPGDQTPVQWVLGGGATGFLGLTIPVVLDDEASVRVAHRHATTFGGSYRFVPVTEELVQRAKDEKKPFSLEGRLCTYERCSDFKEEGVKKLLIEPEFPFPDIEGVSCIQMDEEVPEQVLAILGDYIADRKQPTKDEKEELKAALVGLLLLLDEVGVLSISIHIPRVTNALAKANVLLNSAVHMLSEEDVKGV